MSRRFLAAAAVALAAAAPAGAADGEQRPPEGAPAKETWPLPPGAPPEVPVTASPYGATWAPPRRAGLHESQFRKPGETVDASDALDEIIEEVAADVLRLGAGRLSPVLLERVRVAGNLDPALGGIVEARLAAAMLRVANAPLLRCVECDATRAEVLDAAWVVSRGITRREQAQDLARRYGARTFLTASLSASEWPAQIALDVVIVRAEDGSIAYAESYRFGGENAMLWRGADRAQTRQQALKELEDRLEARPRWGLSAQFGLAVVEAKGLGGPARGGYGAIRMDERFGDDRKHRISIIGGGFTHPNVAGGIFQVGVGTRVSPPNLWSQVFELGVAAGGFIGGGIGNAPLATVSLDYRPAIRIGAHVTLGYIQKFRVGKEPAPIQLPSGQIVENDDRPTFGGAFAEAGVSFSW